MPHLNFEDTLGAAEVIATAGAPKAGEFFPDFYRTKPASFAEARAVQQDRLSFSEQASIALRDLQRRLAATKDTVERNNLVKLIEDHQARTERRMAGFAEGEAAALAKLETDVRCIDAACEFLKETVGRGKRIRDVSLPTVALSPTGIAATIEVKRAGVIASAERRADIENRPAPARDLKAAISRAVAAEAEKGRPPFDPCIRGRDPSKFADQMLVRVHTGQSLTVGGGGVPFLVWFLAEQIEARLHGMVDEADLTGAMSDAEQAAALTSLDAERLALEREEEALIRMAEADGMTIARRADASPMAVLMVEVH